MLLELDLQLRIQRDGAQRARLVAVLRRARHLPVAAARRREHKPRGAGCTGGLQQLEGCGQIDLLRELRLLPARGISDDRGEVHHGVDVLHRPADVVPAPDVTGLELEG